MLTVGIPSYRLPKNIIEAEIQVMRDMGVEFKTGVEIGKDFTISQLREQGYKAFFMGIGAQECKALGIPGEDLEGVVPGVEYLRDINLGKKVSLGDRVAVIGGGNVAMDTVRTALRNGSSKPFHHLSPKREGNARQRGRDPRVPRRRHRDHDPHQPQTNHRGKRAGKGG